MQNGSTMEQQNEISDKIDECIKKINKNPILKTINLAEVNIFPLTVISGEEDSCNYIVDVLNWNINSFNIIDDNWVYTLELNLDKRFNNYETTVFIPVTEEIKVKFDELLTKKSKLSLKNVLTPLYVELFEWRSVMDQLIITNDNFDYFFEIV